MDADGQSDFNMLQNFRSAESTRGPLGDTEVASFALVTIIVI
jgi:hypothetical protein